MNIFLKLNCPRLYIEVNVLFPDQAVKLPTATSSSLRHYSLRTDTQKLLFKNGCITNVIAILEKLLEKSPIKYRGWRAPSSVSPFNMAIQQKKSIQVFKYLCDKLYDNVYRAQSKKNWHLLQSNFWWWIMKVIGIRKKFSLGPFWYRIIYAIFLHN